MISLSGSDIMAAFIGGPLLIVNVSVDIFQTEWPCKINRSIFLFLAILSVNNLLLISIEQYLGIFHWTTLPPTSLVKWSIVAIWVEAVLASLMSFLFNDSLRIDLNDHQHTLVCTVNSELPYSQESFFAVFAFAYFIPICFAFYAAVSILHHIINLNKSKIKVSYIKQQQFKNARLFIDIILGFLLPYILITVYHIYRVVTESEFSFVSEYVFRYGSTVLSISNCVINPAIYFTRSRDFRKKVKSSLSVISFSRENTKISNRVHAVVVPICDGRPQ
jgi:hypothetical protein